MKIVDKLEPRTVTFGKLLSGDVFYSTKGGIFIKIKTDCKDYNAVHLRSGVTVSFADYDLVKTKEATLVIGGDEDENNR